MKIWNPTPENPDCAQGDVNMFPIPASIKIDTTDEIRADVRGRLILAEGEVTGHHHAITLFREDGSGSGLGLISQAGANEMLRDTLKAKTGTARLYRDPEAIRELVKLGELTTDRLAIGLLVVEGAPVVLDHDEHESVQIPVGRFYVGGQQEFDAATARRVAD